MPFVLTETVHNSPSGAKDALDKIRQFALSLGWTVDYWSTTDGGGSDYYLQIWSPGYVANELCYRFYVTNVDVQEDTLSLRAVVPTKRWDQSNKIASTTTTWGGNATSYYNVSLPTGTFTALYLYGSKRFISAILHVDPIAVITIQVGTWDLYPSWWYYGPGPNFFFSPQTWAASSDFKWYNITSNPSYWNPPMTQRLSSSVGYNLWWEGAKRDTTNYGCNFRPTSTVAIGSEVGEFNKMTGVLRYNAYTGKRMAMQSTFFARNPSLGVWYPLGVSPFAWVYGNGLTIGEIIKFGSDEYRCFPGVFSNYDQWQAYRVA